MKIMLSSFGVSERYIDRFRGDRHNTDDQLPYQSTLTCA
jgi:hypothetical protein